MKGTHAATTLSERQLRLIGQISRIDDGDLLLRLERLVDLHASGLRVLDDAEMEAILDDLRPTGS